MKTLLLLLLSLVTLSLSLADEELIYVNVNIDQESFQKLESSIPFFDTVHANRGKGNNVTAELKMNEIYLKTLEQLSILHSIPQKEVKREIDAREFRLRGVKPKDDPTPNSYHSNERMKEYLMSLNKEYPEITRLNTIGKSENGWDLTVITIHKFKREEGDSKIVPQFKYIANMHGDETVGRELMLSFALYLCQGYTNGVAEIADLVKNVEISILPSMNPDGFAVKRRENGKGVDLNRNFDDQYVERRSSPQPEMLAVKNWSLANHFVLSANFHGGAVVANYPFDGDKNKKPYGNTPNYSPDQDTFLWLAETYANNNPEMKGSRDFDGGVTNGAQWYPLYGGMQDWNYLNTDCFEITVELSDIKNPAEVDLPRYWRENQVSLVSYLKKVRTGIHGKILDAAGNPLNGNISVEGISKSIKSKNGLFFRMLKPGQYKVTVEVEGYLKQTKEVTTQDNTPTYVDLILEVDPLKTVPSSSAEQSSTKEVATSSSTNPTSSQLPSSTDSQKNTDTSSEAKSVSGWFILLVLAIVLGGVVLWAYKTNRLPKLPFMSSNQNKYRPAPEDLEFQ